MKHGEITQKVRDILNEHGGDNALSITTDRVLLDEYIECAIPDAVIMLAQKGYAVNVKTVTFENAEDDLVVNQGFLSLIHCKCVDWKKDVTRLTELDSVEYAMAQNEFTKPKANSPMVVYLPEIDDLVLMPSGANGTVVFNAKYTKPTEVDTEALTASPKEAAAVCYMTAALVLGLFGDDQGKQRLSDISTNMLQ